jgi:preprotein translocase subunit SecG
VIRAAEAQLAADYGLHGRRGSVEFLQTVTFFLALFFHFLSWFARPWHGTELSYK